MNGRTLWIMFALVVIAGVYVLSRSDGGPDASARDPLRLVDYSAIRGLACETAEWSWEMKPGDPGWLMTSPQVAGGHPVPVDDEIRHRLLGFLQDSRSSSDRPVEGLDPAEWGLEPPALRISITDDERTHEIHVGRADLHDEVYYREPQGDRVFKVSAVSVSDFRLEPRWLRAPRLCDFVPHLVKKITIRHRDGETFALEKTGVRWFVRPEGESLARADGSFCEQYVAAVVAMQGEPTDARPDDEDAPPLWTAEIVGDDDGVARYAIVSEIAGDGAFLAQRPGEPDFRRVKKSMDRFIEKRARDLLDPIFTGFDPRDLSAITVEGHGRSRALRVVKKHRRWYIEFANGFLWRVDQDEFNAFRDTMLNLRMTERVAEPPELAPEVTITFEFDARTKVPPAVVRIAAPRPDGSRLATRSDERAGAILEPAAGRALDRRYWQLMAHDVAAGNDASIEWLQITERDGTVHELTKVERDGKPVWEMKGGHEVATEFLEGLLRKLAHLTVAEYVGLATPEQRERLANPRFRIRWRHPEHAEGAAPAAPDVPQIRDEKEWVVGQRVDDIHWECLVSTFPGLVFLVEGQDLNRVTDAVNGIKRSR